MNADVFDRVETWVRANRPHAIARKSGEVEGWLLGLQLRPVPDLVRLICLDARGGVGPGHGTLPTASGDDRVLDSLGLCRELGVSATAYPLFDLGAATILWIDTSDPEGGMIIAFEGQFFKTAGTLREVLSRWLDGTFSYDEYFTYGGTPRTLNFLGRSATLPARAVLGVRGTPILGASPAKNPDPRTPGS